MNECDLQHAEVVLGRLLVAGEDAAAFLQPTNEALDDVSFAVRVAVELDGPRVGILVALGGDHGRNALAEEIRIDPIRTESFVARQANRPQYFLHFVAGDDRALQQRFQRLRLMDLPRGEVGVQRVPVAIAEEMDFRGKSPARTA